MSFLLLIVILDSSCLHAVHFQHRAWLTSAFRFPHSTLGHRCPRDSSARLAVFARLASVSLVCWFAYEAELEGSCIKISSDLFFHKQRLAL